MFGINSEILLHSHLILKLIPFQCTKLHCYLCNPTPEAVNKNPKLRFENGVRTEFLCE